jgi:RES domain-containing protein
MIVFRLSKSKFARDLSGRGAEIAGGRWNSKGVPVIYTGDSRALCVAEIAVHTGLGTVPEDYVLVTIEIPDDALIYEILPEALQPNWKSFPHTGATQVIGDKLLKQNNYLAIKVPSAVVQGDFNYLINPGHKDFNNVTIQKTEAFSFDKRMFLTP